MSGKATQYSFMHVPKKLEGSTNRLGQNAFPRLLEGKQLKALVLPGNFDTSIHHAAKVSGKVKATPLSKLAERIATLEKRKLQVG